MCRASPSEFVIPYYKYLKAQSTPLTVGSRFKMKFESEESSERRCIIFLSFSFTFVLSGVISTGYIIFKFILCTWPKSFGLTDSYFVVNWVPLSARVV